MDILLTQANSNYFILFLVLRRIEKKKPINLKARRLQTIIGRNLEKAHNK
jgi:hypothetical protein